MATALDNDLLFRLITAESVPGVIEALEQTGYWTSDEMWRPVGDLDSNFAIINNQQSDPFAALTEKLVNSMDAILVGECRRRGIDPTSADAPLTMREGVARFIENHTGPMRDSDGRMELWEEKGLNRTAIAKRIVLAASGDRKRDNKNVAPNLSVIDDGEGQTPANFPGTFMSLQKGNKINIQFVQGKWNMGGTGVLQFCAAPHHLQVLVSKRDPALVTTDASPGDHNWGYTVVRRRSRRAGERTPVFEYLAPVGAESGTRGEVLECDNERLPLYPSETPDRLFGRETTHGTLVKMFGYKWDSKKATQSSILVGKSLYSQVDSCLPSSLLPVRLFEGRDFKSSSSAVTALGLVNRLRDQASDTLEAESPIKGELTVMGQRIPVLVYVFREGAKRDTYMAKYGVIFMVNGQKHGDFASGFFSTKAVDKTHLRGSMGALLDFSHVEPEFIDNLFMASRDRVRQTDFLKELRSQLEQFLKGNDILREINNRRRQEQLDKMLADDSSLEDVLRNLLRRSPLLAKYFKLGAKIPAPFPGPGGGAGTSGEFVGKLHPTFFRFKKGSIHREREAEVGRTSRLVFETDVENSYFSRSRYQGSHLVSEANSQLISGHWGSLHDGVIAYTMSPREAEDLGKVLKLAFAVADDTMQESLTCTCELTIVPTKGPTPSGTTGIGSAPDAGSGSAGTAAHFTVPEISPSSHNKMEGWTELTAMTVDLEEGKANRFIYNRENKFLLDAQKASKTDEKLLDRRFQIGLALLSLALIDDLDRRQDNQREEGVDEPLGIEDEVERFTRAIAPVILPLVEALAEISIDDLLEVEPDA